MFAVPLWKLQAPLGELTGEGKVRVVGVSVCPKKVPATDGPRGTGAVTESRPGTTVGRILTDRSGRSYLFTIPFLFPRI